MTQEAFQVEFVKFKDQLKSYLFRLVTHQEAAEDLTQDAYIKASEKLESFKGNSSLKTWVFTIATNLARDHKRVQQRWGTDWMDLVRDAHVNDSSLMERKMSKVFDSPHTAFVMSEHLNYCFNCTSKTLLLEQQMCLWLKTIYEFTVAEVQLITGLSEGKVKHAVADARKIMTDIFEKKCALINKEGMCSQCTGLNQMYNPKQNAQEEANKLKIVKQGQGKNQEELMELRLAMIQDLDPLKARGLNLHGYLIEHSPEWALAQKT